MQFGSEVSQTIGISYFQSCNTHLRQKFHNETRAGRADWKMRVLLLSSTPIPAHIGDAPRLYRATRSARSMLILTRNIRETLYRLLASTTGKSAEGCLSVRRRVVPSHTNIWLRLLTASTAPLTCVTLHVPSEGRITNEMTNLRFGLTVRRSGKCQSIILLHLQTVGAS